jgi:hypothetical protein
MLTIDNSVFCPQSVFIGFIWLSEQTAITFTHSIIQLTFVMIMGRVFFAARTEYLIIIKTSFCFKGLM